MGGVNHTLTIVIPALNEEDAIGATIERCLDARTHIKKHSHVDDVEIIVVSDGSTDRTEEIARGFEGVTVLAFERNRGYGAAIKCGFDYGRGDLVGFLDADGTCDPRSFADLCRAIDEQHADVVVGSRMGPENKMPWGRTVGNKIFAWMLGILSKRSVSDTASGMRVIRRDRLAELYPLPDGLHFTPAMSARVLLEDNLRLVEVPMSYAERVGRSKLSVLRDGARFFRVILRTALCYRPSRLLLLGAGLLTVLSLAVSLGPVSFYLTAGRLEEWMIYRILFSFLLAILAGLLVCGAVVGESIAATTQERSFAASGVTAAVARLFTRRWRRIGGAALVAAAVALTWPGIVQYATSGQVDMHWSRAVLASLLLVAAAMLGITMFLLNMLDLIREQRAGEGVRRVPDRMHTADSAAARPRIAASPRSTPTPTTTSPS